MLVLLYGREGWFAPLLRATNFNIVFAFPGARPARLPQTAAQPCRLHGPLSLHSHSQTTEELGMPPGCGCTDCLA